MTESNASIEATRWLRAALVVAGLSALLWTVNRYRRRWRDVLRLMAILGYGYALLAVLRVDHWFPAAPSSTQDNSASGTQAALPSLAARRVIWIIFDEMDYDKTLGSIGTRQDLHLKNLEHLASMGISAENAYPPAKDTKASLPALLTGYALTGMDFKDGWIRLKTRDAGMHLFTQGDSVFNRLPGGPRSAAILGFYHPYCTLFPMVDPCVASPDMNVGRWFDALTFFGQETMATLRWIPDSGIFIPGDLFHTFEPMYRITQTTLEEFSRFVNLRDKSLVFIHVNLPHPPADYAQRVEHLAHTGDDRESYRRNLYLVDDLIGKAVSQLQTVPDDQKTLLIVSSDHWHRIESPLVARRIPWIAWLAGSSIGMRLDEKINTVNTADLVIDFLEGKLDTQAQIDGWWRERPFSPTLMPHGYDY